MWRQRFSRDRSTDMSIACCGRTRQRQAIITPIPEVSFLATGYSDMSDAAQPAVPRLAKPYMQADLSRILGDV